MAYPGPPATVVCSELSHIRDRSRRWAEPCLVPRRVLVLVGPLDPSRAQKSLATMARAQGSPATRFRAELSSFGAGVVEPRRDQ